MISGFDFLAFQSIVRFPTKNAMFLSVMQSTITKGSLLVVFYQYVLVFYPYAMNSKSTGTLTQYNNPYNRMKPS